MRTEKRHDVETMGGALVTSVAPPPVREYQPVTPETTGMPGRRVVMAQPLAWWHDMRAVSEPYQSETGEWLIRVTDEAYWYDADRDAAKVPLSLVISASIREVWAE